MYANQLQKGRGILWMGSHLRRQKDRGIDNHNLQGIIMQLLIQDLYVFAFLVPS